jgi:hypothetical protein
MSTLTQEYVNSLFHYDKEKALLTWKVRKGCAVPGMDARFHGRQLQTSTHDGKAAQ